MPSDACAAPQPSTVGHGALRDEAQYKQIGYLAENRLGVQMTQLGKNLSLYVCYNKHIINNWPFCLFAQFFLIFVTIF